MAPPTSIHSPSGPETVVRSVTDTALRLLPDAGAVEPFTTAYRPWLARVS